MKLKSVFFLLASSLIFYSISGHAQFSMVETDSSNRLRLFGRHWNTNFFSLASTETDKMNDDGGRLSTYNYFTFSSYLDFDYRFAFRVPFQYNTAGTDRFGGSKVHDEELFLQDLILEVQNYSLFMLPWDLNLYWAGRIYLPTSKHSRKAQTITRLRNHFILTKPLGRHVEIEYDQKLNYYVQSRTSYDNSFEDEYGMHVDNWSLTKQAKIEQWVQAWYKITSQTGIGWKIGLEDEFWNKSKSLNRSKEPLRKIRTGPSLRFPATENISFIFTYEDTVERRQSDQLGRFLAKNTQFTLLSFIRF